MGRRGRPRLCKLSDELARAHPSLEDPEASIRRGVVVVDGRVVSNPASLVRAGAAITLRPTQPARGQMKLNGALVAFHVDVRDRVALDVGAAAGGFTQALLEAGAGRVYAVDAGHGQLPGALRQHARVVNLERTNLGDLNPGLVPEQLELVTLDLSYLALARAVPQLSQLRLSPRCSLLALVKPQFELGLGQPPSDETTLEEALNRAQVGVAAAGWAVLASIRSPLLGGRGAIEYFIHARKET